MYLELMGVTTWMKNLLTRDFKHTLFMYLRFDLFLAQL